MAGRRAATRRIGLAIGTAATVVGGIVYSLGWLDRLDGYNLDLHFRHFNRIQADPRIVLIDIDDSSLRAMPDWPWPRRVYADLVRTLHSMGARTIVLDLVFAEPSAPRVEHAGLGKHYDIDTAFTELGDRANDKTIYDDDELRDAIRKAGNVYLAMFGRVFPAGAEAGYALDDARTNARRFLQENPGGTWDQFRQHMLPREPADAQTPERESLLTAFRQALSMRAIEEKLPRVPAGLEAAIPSVVHETPPVEKFAERAVGVGLVSFHRGEQDTVRRLPLLVNADGVLLPQLGVLVALDALGVSAKQIALRDDAWMFGPRAIDLAAGLDRAGASLLNWYRPADGDWRRAFVHIPAGRLLEGIQQRRALNENEARAVLAREELVCARYADTPGAYDEYVRQVNLRHWLLSPKPRANLLLQPRSTGDAPHSSRDPSSEELTASIEKTEREAVVWVQRAWSLWRDEEPKNAEEAAERDRIKRLYDRFGEGQYLASLERANANMHQRMSELGKGGPTVYGKICLVGYTATAMADMVPTPVDPAMPGVMVHANVINMFLQNRFAAAAPLAVNLLLFCVAGIAATVITTTCRPRVSVPLVLALGVGLLALGATLFAVWTYHAASIVAVGVTALSWASVTAYRQATEERARRAFHRALAQYTSPAVATRIAERTRADDLAPQQAVVTCFFSDLTDFTRLSERLGPQRTRGLLEPYLRGVSAALLDHHAIVNKFMGDGVFAFFNAPILPCADHAAAACESALAAQAAVAQWNDQGRPSGELGPLTVRIGLSTGEAFVGDYGSDMKLDYTCIGDTVNLGSRLERANKAFGTTILVDDSTRGLTGAGFAFRSLGKIDVAGKAAPVCVHELVGRVASVDEETPRYIALFERAVADFQHCQWDSCRTILAECRELRPLDRAIAVYEEAVVRHVTTPPSSDWAGAIELRLH